MSVPRRSQIVLGASPVRLTIDDVGNLYSKRAIFAGMSSTKSRCPPYDALPQHMSLEAADDYCLLHRLSSILYCQKKFMPNVLQMARRLKMLPRAVIT